MRWSVAFILLLVSQSAHAQSAPAAVQEALSAAPAQSSTTRLLPFSGVLADASGAPATSPATATFALFETQEGGNVLWTEVQQVQPDARGRYTVYLGNTTPLPLAAFSQEQARWLQVEVEGRPSARVALVAVPYALRAADAETLGGTPLSSFVRTGADGRLRTGDGTTAISEPLVDGSGVPGQLAKFIGTTEVSSSIITETGTNRIGIGTTDPSEGGAFDSKVTIRGTDGGTALAISNQVGTPRFALNIGSDGSWVTFDRATGTFQPGIAQRGGRVGISTTDPTGGGVVDSKFTVRNLDNNTGIAVLNQADARRFALNTLSTGAWLMYDGGGGVWNSGLSQLSGNIAVGTTPSASAKITVLSSTSTGVLSTSSSGNGLWGITATISGAGVIGDNSAGGEAVVGRTTSDIAGAVVGRNDGEGYGVRGFVTTSAGIGVLGQGGISGGTGRGGRFENVNGASAANALEAATNGTGTGLYVNHTGASGNIAVFQSASANVARIDKTGRGFFNGGTQASGADVAEAFAVDGSVSQYEPGDVLEISADHDRRVRKSTRAYSTRVVGVYATKPGVLLSDLSIDADASERIPMGVIGVIPTKVSAENGVIRRGDLLVASKTPGHAMKAGARVPTGAVVGKALADFVGPGTGVIDVFVNVR